jgi:heme o synthase
MMTRTLRALAVATAAVTIALFAVGGLVRGSGSGLGCSTWPQCLPGQLFPSGGVHSLIEFSHRALAFCVIVLTLATATIALLERRAGRAAPLKTAITAFPLVLGQAVLGGIVVHTDLDPWWVTAHFVVAMALIADVVAVAVLTRRPRDGDAAVDPGYANLTVVTALAIGALLLVGTYIRARGPQVGLAFTDWPLMDGRLVPSLDAVTTPMFAHRALALGAAILALWTAIRARTASPRSGVLVARSTVLVGLLMLQVAVGAANVFSRLQPWAVVAHVALSVLIWSAAVAIAIDSLRARRSAVPVEDDGPVRSASMRDTISAYVALTKPRIIVLLLITTVPAMILAARGLPSIWLILATLLGGTLAAAAANAINMYLDRDIDEVMRRTRRRPLPRHALTADHALRFGYALAALSFLFLASTVNMLAATLALAAIVFYVVVYTMWLKRSTTQNIVIGGAAGAAPVLVGWAAVTGTLAWPAWVLFAVIFVWTPPHFWALAMRVRDDYAAAGVPMLPVVKGDDETRRQIFLYSLVLFGATLLLVPAAGMGPVYVTTAVGLGGTFSWRALVLWRTPTDARAWGLFRFSILYLAALFGAVALDALV